MKGVKWGLLQFINRQNQDQSITLTGQKEAAAASGSADTPSSTVAHVCSHAPMSRRQLTHPQVSVPPTPTLAFNFDIWVMYCLMKNSTLWGKSLLPNG